MRDGRAAENERRRTPEFRERERAAYAAHRGGLQGEQGEQGATVIRAADRRPRVKPDRPFVGIDGEGAGTDETGRQLFMLLRAGADELFTGKPLSTRACFDFLTSLPKGPIYVGFSIGYDITMMLRDLPHERVKWLLNERGIGRTSWTFFDGFAISWLPKNYIMIGRTYRSRDPDGRMKERVMKGSVRTIYEVFGFFQKSFLKVLHEFDVGSLAHRETIERNKVARGHFAGEGLTDDVFCPFITAEERDYCALECGYLAELMEQFRQLCYGAGIRPRTWNGAGKLSAALHRDHDTITAARVAEVMPTHCECPACIGGTLPAMASRAYYGGRFETTRHGPVQAPDHGVYGPNRCYLYEYDIRSAYPAEMVKLPCLEHGRWMSATPRELARLPDDALFIAPVVFKHAFAGRANLCGLPVRQKDGRIMWPVEGNGVYWSTELRAAALLGCRVRYSGPGWVFVRGCDCRPFDWLERLYRYRQSLGGSLKGYPIKLGINGTYGKLVQRVGAPKWANLIWGGLITAGTRGQLMRAAAYDPEAIVMMATDGLFSRAPLPLDIGSDLGQWEVSRHERLLIVQPGVYFGASRPKTRGVSPSFFHREAAGEPYRMRFERAWHAFAKARHGAAPITPPGVTLPVRLFIGTKQAYARNRLETAGRWVETDRLFSFRWIGKRGASLGWEGDTGWSYPPPGSPTLINHPHKGDPAIIEAFDLEHGELDDQPDYVDLSPVDKG